MSTRWKNGSEVRRVGHSKASKWNRALGVLAVAITALALPLRATVYFVDFGTGSDSNSGTSTNSAWKHLPGDPAATGNPGIATINGDTIYLKGGVTYGLGGGAIVVSSARYNRSNGAKFISGHLDSWGTGRAVVDGVGTARQWFNIGGVANVTFRGLEIRNTIYSAANDGALYFYDSPSAIVDGCLIHGAGINSPSAHQDCVEISGSSTDCLITNCVIYDSTQKCIETYNTSHRARIVNNVLYNARDHVVVLSSDMNTVSGNIISNAPANVLQTPFADPGAGIKMVSSSGVTSRTNSVFNNVIYHCGIGVLLENVGNQDMGYNKVMNNTFADCGVTISSAYGYIDFNVTSTGRINNSLVQNNIFYDFNNSFNGMGIRIETANVGNNNTISHNLWYDPTIVVYVRSGPNNVTLANFSDSGSTSPDYRFAAIGSGNSFDVASQMFNVDPKFTSYPSILSLQPTSRCVSAGTNLSGYFTTDALGNTRTSWSLGAYEHGAYRLPTPTGLYVVEGR